jgi:hypothetical protein
MEDNLKKTKKWKTTSKKKWKTEQRKKKNGRQPQKNSLTKKWKINKTKNGRRPKKKIKMEDNLNYSENLTMIFNGHNIVTTAPHNNREKSHRVRQIF